MLCVPHPALCKLMWLGLCIQAVEAPELSIMVPLLIRGLRERVTAIKRKSALIIDNMAKVPLVLIVRFCFFAKHFCFHAICCHSYPSKSGLLPADYNMVKPSFVDVTALNTHVIV